MAKTSRIARALKRQRRHEKRDIKKNDKRGKHTKASREERKQLEAERHARARKHSVCVHCDGTQFGHTADGASMVCIGCGFVFDNEPVMPDLPEPEDIRSVASNVYLHRNYFAERMRQWNNTEPRLTTLQKSQIYGVQSFLERKVGHEWSPGVLSKDKFGQICRILDQIRPGQRWRQKLERWFQAKLSLCGPCDYVPDLPPDHLVYDMKVLFDAFAYTFARHFRNKGDFGRNVPKLDLVCLVLMYNIDKQALWRYGWFFMSDRIWWESQSTLRDYERCKLIVSKCNECLLREEPRKVVRRDTYRWFQENKLVMPSLDTLRSWVPYNYNSLASVPYVLKLTSVSKKGDHGRS